MRPLGVTLVGAYQIFRGVSAFVLGGYLMKYTGLAAKFLSFAHGNALERFFIGMAYAAALGVIVLALAHALAGYGVLQRRNWGRLLALLLSALELSAVLNGAVHGQFILLVSGLIDAAMIIYLAMPPVRRAFDTAARPVGAAASPETLA
jgi:hypothetical protein